LRFETLYLGVSLAFHHICWRKKIMRNVILLRTASFAMVLFAVGTSAQAQTWVSATGSDANTCTQASPCATFAKAYTVAGAGGTILCLNSGQYATTTLTITTDVTIDCGEGAIGRMDLTSGSVGINISAGSAVHVTLRHLSMSGASGSSGIVATIPAGSLVIEDSIIKGFTGTGSNGYGILFTPTGSGRSSLSLSSTKVQSNNIGVSVAPASGQITSVGFYSVGIGGNGTDGLDLAGAGVTAGDMRQSVLANNGANGFVGSSAGGVFFTIEGSTVSANLGVGIQTNAAAANVAVAASTIGGNGMGIRALSGSLLSFGDNHISANGSNGTFTGVTPLQ
jgi:hypothetical protein